MFKGLLAFFVLMSVAFEGLYVDMYAIYDYMTYTTEVIQ